MSHHSLRKRKNIKSKNKRKNKNTKIPKSKIKKSRYTRRRNILIKRSIYSQTKLKGKGMKNKSFCPELDYNSCSKIRDKNKKIRICKFNYKKQFCESI